MDHNNSAAIAAGIAAYGLVISVFVLGFVVLSIVAYWRIAAKAGYNGALSLLLFVPLANFAIMLIFAFSEWPIEQQLRASRTGSAPGPGPWQPPAPGPWQPPMPAPPTT
ncbi:MAG: hypothetical protein ABI346_10015 [Candidatus Baltobacteraceae bacterium]